MDTIVKSYKLFDDTSSDVWVIECKLDKKIIIKLNDRDTIKGTLCQGQLKKD